MSKRPGPWKIVGLAILVIVAVLSRVDLEEREDFISLFLFAAICVLLIGGSLLRDRRRRQARGTTGDGHVNGTAGPPTV